MTSRARRARIHLSVSAVDRLCCGLWRLRFTEGVRERGAPSVVPRQGTRGQLTTSVVFASSSSPVFSACITWT